MCLVGFSRVSQGFTGWGGVFWVVDLVRNFVGGRWVQGRVGRDWNGRVIPGPTVAESCYGSYGEVV
jgi:hypothetical protein